MTNEIHEISIDDLDHVTGGKAPGGGIHTTGTGGGDGLGWLRNTLREVLRPLVGLGGADTALKHENVHSS